MTVPWVLRGEWEPSFIDVPQEGPESVDFITTAHPQWMNLYVSDTGRLDEFFEDTGSPKGDDSQNQEKYSLQP